MSEEALWGTEWAGDDLILIVADYFAMRADELAGRPYVKTMHNALLRGHIGRSRGSVEFKHTTFRPCSKNWACLGSPATSRCVTPRALSWKRLSVI
jgi:hypothetical protein